jgi:integral membrane protein
MPQKITLFARIAVLEAISYLLLLGIAMPLKYFFNYPMAVTLVGWAHGVLFMLYMVALLVCWREYAWSFKRVIMYFMASLLPVVPFYIERSLVQEYTNKG